MQIFESITSIRDYSKKSKAQGSVVGFVPTMGFFHDGHLELMRQARKECDIVIMSIFVNPLQFGLGEDYEDYPRDTEKDLEKAGGVGVDAVFMPDSTEMYPEGFDTGVKVGRLADILCGRSRPGHFNGVATVVLKLFNIVQPDKAYFGLKDVQQAMVIKGMIKDFNLDVEMVPAPIVREKDGLAKSSRNIYLNSREREAATVLYKSLKLAEERFSKGERNAAKLKDAAVELITSEPLAELDYAEILTFPDLEECSSVENGAILTLAVNIGRARLIDNIILEVK